MVSATTAGRPSAAGSEVDDGFPVAWEQPGDAEQTWTWHAAGCPLPLTPLSIDHSEAVYVGIDRERGMRRHEEGRRLYPHGFVYALRRPRPGPDAPPVDPVVEERRRAHDALAARLRDAWQHDFEPAIRRLCHGIRDRDYDSMSAAEIAGALPDLFEDSGRAFGLTMAAYDGVFAAMRPFADLCQELFGPSQGEALAGELVGGFASYTTGSEVGIWRLARLAERFPAVRAAILGAPAASAPAALRTLEGGDRFLAQLDSYLDLYGWRPEMWLELTLPLWAEDPAPLMRLLRGYIEDPGADPRRAGRRAAARRRQLLGRARAQVAGAPERRERFESLYARACAYVPVRENRALWQLTTTGVLRRPCLALGRKLCAAGRLDSPADVCYLRLEELLRLADGGRGGGEAGPDHRALILERRADRARWLGLVPPLVIGTPDPTAIDELVAKQGRFASLGLDAGAAEVVRGLGASRGVARGRARVVHSLAETDRLAPGEVLVCRTTSPAWTPLIARAAAVVADAGGVLAHCAIVAREHAIPCVVGTGVATERIADGALVTVDGGRGLVHLEHATAPAEHEPVGPLARQHVAPAPTAPPARPSRQPAHVSDAPAAPPTRPSRQPAHAGRAPAVPATRPSRQLAHACSAPAALATRPSRQPARAGGAPVEGRPIDAAPIVWLGDPAGHDPAQVGGKAANLSRLAGRHRVPPGFCLTAAAYRPPAAGEGALPPSLRAAVRAAYAELGERCGHAAPAVAVRSSALDEDGGAASFAGQHETVLNVIGVDALEAAIARCWRSLHAERALAYRARRGLDAEGARLAVLVQQLVPADAAAVLFSANPITNRRDEAVVTASYGLGASIVDGTVAPDTYTVRTGGSDGPRIVERQLGQKTVMTVPVDGGTAEAPVPASLRTRQALHDAQILEAVRLGIALEQEMGWPVDLECAWKDGRLYVLQCRPITTLT